MNFWILFGVLGAVNVALVLLNRSGQHIPKTTTDFQQFQYKYLAAYYLASASDWLQGPYVYALYESYGFGIGDIGSLFVAGFGSSMIFGTIVGSIGDKYGRKLSCLVYIVLYIYSCSTKHFNDYWILFSGRITGGIATSILFSAFESWMVSEHFSHNYPEDWLGYTFYLQVFGNGVVAIVSGLVASYAVSFFNGAMTAPFDVAILLLFIGGIVIYFTWTENYGNATVDWKESFVGGYNAIVNDYKVACLGISQSFFEAAMYIFVFMWTPTLDTYFKNYSHGLVFACFMVCVMIGSSTFKVASSAVRIELLLVYVFITSIASLSAPFIQHGGIVLTGFLMYETCVGMFWPSIGTLKGKYIPENVRSTVMNYFRIPTNMFVLLVLNRVKSLSTEYVFMITLGLLAIAVLSQVYVARSAEGQKVVDKDAAVSSSNNSDNQSVPA